MTISRTIAATTILVSACLLIYALSIQPYRANILKERVEHEFEALRRASMRQPPSFEPLRTARARVAEIRDALRYSPTDVDLHLELAAHQRLLTKLDAQIATYNRVLSFHRRPEIFQTLALAELETGRLETAVEQFSHAVAFDHLYIHSVPYYLHEDVIQHAERYRSAMANRLMPQ